MGRLLILKIVCLFVLAGSIACTPAPKPTEQPETKVEKPDVITDKPEAISEKPEGKAEKPEAKTEKPEVKEEKEYTEDQIISMVVDIETEYADNPSPEDAIAAIKKLEALRMQSRDKRFFLAVGKIRKLSRKYDRVLTKHLFPKMQEILNAAQKAYMEDSVEAALAEFEKIDEKWLEFGTAARSFLAQKQFYRSIKTARDNFPNAISDVDSLIKGKKYFAAYDDLTGFYAKCCVAQGCLLSNKMQTGIKNRMDMLEGKIVKEFGDMSSAKKEVEFRKFISRHAVDIRVVGNYLDEFQKIGKEVGVEVR